jgi:hypothetical protein
MRNRLTLSPALTTAAVLMMASIATAYQTAPTPPTPPQTPAAAHERDVIMVRQDVPGMFVVGDRSGREAQMVKTAFLGVGVSAAPSVLSEQLKLPQGVGLVVEFVEKGSPAEKAGVQAKDVIHKLDEQLLINPQQLATLVRTFKPSDGVKLTVIRKGEVMSLDATLVEKELPELSANTTQAFEFFNAPAALPRGAQMSASSSSTRPPRCPAALRCQPSLRR